MRPVGKSSGKPLDWLNIQHYDTSPNSTTLSPNRDPIELIARRLSTRRARFGPSCTGQLDMDIPESRNINVPAGATRITRWRLNARDGRIDDRRGNLGQQVAVSVEGICNPVLGLIDFSLRRRCGWRRHCDACDPGCIEPGTGGRKTLRTDGHDCIHAGSGAVAAGYYGRIHREWG